MNKADAYQGIAPYYSALSYLGTFGGISRLRKKINWSIVRHRKILLVGIGTGDLIPHITAFNPNSVLAIDASNAMLDQARTKYSGRNVVWQNDHFPNLDMDSSFDVIVLDFVVDTLSEEELTAWLKVCQGSLNSGGRLIILDFMPVKSRFHYTRLVMRFFRIFTNYSPKQILNWQRVVNESGLMRLEDTHYALNGVLNGCIWKKLGE